MYNFVNFPLVCGYHFGPRLHNGKVYQVLYAVYICQ